MGKLFSFFVFQEKRGSIPMKQFYELCSRFKINFDKEDIEALLKLLNIIVDEKINYSYFIDLISRNGSHLILKPYQGICTYIPYKYFRWHLIRNIFITARSN